MSGVPGHWVLKDITDGTYWGGEGNWVSQKKAKSYLTRAEAMENADPRTMKPRFVVSKAKATRVWVLDLLRDENPEAMLADGFEEALVGVSRRYGQDPIAAYSYEKCIAILMKRDGLSQEDAVEHFNFNVIGAWVGKGTPAYIQTEEM